MLMSLHPVCVAQEGPTEPDSDVKIVVGHRFMKRDSNSSKHYCEKCTSVIWGVFQTWYKCTGKWNPRLLVNYSQWWYHNVVLICNPTLWICNPSK